ncbi:MAG: class III signal peptide-containing protein, partial [Planctomycetales bacterium]|nr:class III signal peptide-containing protein [Planctomycetales bacterium]
MLRKMFRSKKGQGLVEYGLIIAGVALICAAAISVFGHKTSDLISAVATVLPGAHADDNGPMISGKLIETTEATATGIALD